MWQTVLLIIFISVIMWILSSLFGGQENERAEPGRRPQSRPRSSTSDIDRFLEEINRRRREGSGKETVAKPVPPPPPPRVRKAAKPPARPVVQRPMPVPTAIPVPARRPSPARPAPVSVVERGREIAPPVLESAVTDVVAVSTAPAAAQASVLGTANRTPPTAVLEALIPLLRSPQQFRSAFLFSQILGEPRCRR